MNEEIEMEDSYVSDDLEENTNTRKLKRCALPANFCFRDEKDELCQQCHYEPD